jgi:hypothetical protein
VSFPDALGAGTYLGSNGDRLLLVPADGALPSSVSSYLSATTTITAAGVFDGTSAVSTTVQDEIGQA